MNKSTELISRPSSSGETFETPFISIVYQSGLPQEVGVNGCRVEDVIQAALARLELYQKGPLACEENRAAMRYLSAARQSLLDRIHRRQEQGVLNTYARHETVRTEDEEHDFSATGA